MNEQTQSAKWATIRSLGDDFLRYRWGDLLAIFLIMWGCAMVVHWREEVIEDVGKSLVAAGLLALRPRTLNPGGNEKETQTK